ncbi:MAG: glycosyltransferase family 1 protein [Alicyclobacillaceae bacterium]|nr:glycosyltransferase family 1 protein [Alicyclobacillaceae bacterium]
MRIAMFSETFLPSTDGVVTRLCATLQRLERSGHEVLLFAPRSQGIPGTYACARVVGVPSFRFFLYPEKRFPQPWPMVGRVLRQFQPDLLHAVNPGFMGPAAVYYARRFRLPLVASYHTHIPTYARYYRLPWLEPFLWWCFRGIHNQAELNLCTSRATIDELTERGFRNLVLWDRGVDLDRFSPAKRSAAMRRRLAGGHDDGRILLYVGRLAPEKGIERLRPCFDKVPGLRLAIVGDGPYRAQLEQVFAGTPTAFTGYLFGDELAEAYASADGFVFPSTTETLGLVLFEAMASGVPVMAADSPATREVLEDGKAGIIFDPTRTESIVEALHSLLEDESKRAAIRQRGLELSARLDWAGPTEQLVRYYQQVLEKAAYAQGEPVQP